MFAQCSSKYVLNDVPNIMQKESLSFFCTLLNLSSLREDKLWPSTIIFLFCLKFASLFRFSSIFLYIAIGKKCACQFEFFSLHFIRISTVVLSF